MEYSHVLMSIPMNGASGPQHSARSSLVIREVFPLPHSPCNAMVMGAEEFSMNLMSPFTYRSVPKSLTSLLNGRSDNEVFFIVPENDSLCMCRADASDT